MKVTVVKFLNYYYHAGGYLYRYLLEAENGIIEEEEVDVYLPTGFVLELSDDAWMPDSETFTIKCDKCGYIREQRSRHGATVCCPVCNTEEVIP